MTTLLLAGMWICGARSPILQKYYYAIDPVREVARSKALSECQAHSLAGCYSSGCVLSNEPMEEESDE